MYNNIESYESVEDYLAAVKLEALSIPDIGTSHLGSNDIINGRLNHSEYLKIIELNDDRFQIIESGSWNEYFTLLKELVKSKYSRQYILIPSSLSKFVKEKYSDWKTAILNPPPPLESICLGGIDFCCVQEGLDVISVELERSDINFYIFEWLFYLLTVLDDLHALSENIASNLQKIKRYCLKGKMTPDKILLVSIISKYFHQE